MKDDVCVVEVGVHPGPYWRDGDKRTREGDRPWVVCSRHRVQYEESADDYGPFDWQPYERAAAISHPLEGASQNAESAIAEQGVTESQ